MTQPTDEAMDLEPIKKLFNKLALVGAVINGADKKYDSNKGPGISEVLEQSIDIAKVGDSLVRLTFTDSKPPAPYYDDNLKQFTFAKFMDDLLSKSNHIETNTLVEKPMSEEDKYGDSKRYVFSATLPYSDAVDALSKALLKISTDHAKESLERELANIKRRLVWSLGERGADGVADKIINDSMESKKTRQ